MGKRGGEETGTKDGSGRPATPVSERNYVVLNEQETMNTFDKVRGEEYKEKLYEERDGELRYNDDAKMIDYYKGMGSEYMNGFERDDFDVMSISFKEGGWVKFDSDGTIVDSYIDGKEGIEGRNIQEVLPNIPSWNGTKEQALDFQMMSDFSRVMLEKTYEDDRTSSIRQYNPARYFKENQQLEDVLNKFDLGTDVKAWSGMHENAMKGVNVGDIIKFDKFTSASTGQVVASHHAEKDNQILVEIDLPRETRAIQVESAMSKGKDWDFVPDTVKHESEILLNRTQEYEVLETPEEGVGYIIRPVV